MGVKGLWSVLAPFCDRKPLYQISGETVAVDLSGWVCDSQNVSEHHSQPKLYLRNLYFRTSYLLLYDVIPVFVLEGQAPEMKRKVMEARRQLQYNGQRRGKNGDISRKRFQNVLNQCERLLSSMGLRCLTGEGEAEAMCAYLNSKKLVSGVISQDSDCFVYGASRLYRNFSVGVGGAGSVDVYDLNRVHQSMDLGRNKMVALALLCGSDYNGTGVEGVGLTSAMAFLQQLSDADVISRLVSWNTDVREYKEWGRKVEDPTTCTSCGHGGHLRTHSRQGCPTCVTHKGCKDGKYKDWRLNMKLELQIRSKALNSVEAFPDPDLMKEFLYHEEELPSNFNPSWGKPDLIKFIKLMTNWLGWTECYSLEKFLPLMIRWQLLHPRESTLKPKTIIKKRNPRGVPCYQVLWTDPEGLYDGLISDDQIKEDEVNVEDLWTTVEKQELIQNVYPQLVEEFEATKIKKKKEKIGAKKKKKQVDDLEGYNDVEIEKKVRKRKAVGDVSFKTKSFDAKRKLSENDKKKKKGIQKTLHSFIGRNASTDSIDRMNPLLRRKLHLFEDNANNTADLLKDLSLGVNDDVNESDLSNIVEDIITKNNFKINLNDISFKENVANFSTPNKNTKRVSYFFGNLSDEYDAFENSIDLKNAPDDCLNVSIAKSRKLKKNKRKNSSLKCNRENISCNLKKCDNDANKGDNGEYISDNAAYRGDDDAHIGYNGDNDIHIGDNDVDIVDNDIHIGDNNVYFDNNDVFTHNNRSFTNINCDSVDFEVDNGVKSRNKFPSIEERLFGCKDGNSMVCSTPDKNGRSVCDQNVSMPSPYTPLAERIRRLKDHV